MSPAEKLFLPVYLFLMAVGYIMAFFKILPASILACLLGAMGGLLLAVRPRHGDHASRTSRGLLFGGALLLDLMMLVLASWIGGKWGYFVMGAEKGRRLGVYFSVFFDLVGNALAVWIAGRRRGKEV
ncbi:MAG: hypothetical protein HFG09_02245 [Oscillibacter sp.]|nr:hypothetical protein [Oscillibacter sp.]